MLTSFDDYPIHQASVPVAHSATGDLNQYDRYFFNGYRRDASSRGRGLYFALAMGLYPNRHVADAAFCAVVGGQHHSVFRSQRAPHDRRDATSLGPIVVEVVEPLKVLRVRVDAPEHGLRADLTPSTTCWVGTARCTPLPCGRGTSSTCAPSATPTPATRTVCGWETR